MDCILAGRYGNQRVPNGARFGRVSMSVILLLAVSATAIAEVPSTADTEGETGLPEVVVHAHAVNRDDLGASRSVVELDQTILPLSPSLADALGRVPGVLVRSRGNLAQDDQLSLRGFGARSTFGVRGVAIVLDDIPASMPDGQGQLSHIDLAALGFIEVLRGPWAALYGNASAGVIRLRTAPGTDDPRWDMGVTGGQPGAWRIHAGARGAQGDLGWNLSVGNFHTDGWREHSAARRRTANAVLDWQPADSRSLRVVINTLDSPWAEDPLGLSPAQFWTNPRQSVPQSREYNTGKSVSQTQAGLVWDETLAGGNTFHFATWAGQREVEQFLPIPPAPQANPLHSGGVIDLAGDYHGARLRWINNRTLGGRPLQLSAQLEYQQLEQHRRGWENFIEQRRGVRGRLRRDERTRVSSLDPVLDAIWQVHPSLALRTGMRRAKVRFGLRDHYVTDANPDDSGTQNFHGILPVAGFDWRPRSGWRVHGAWGRGLETPTLTELGYRADGGAGLALDLAPARSIQRELGLGWSSDERIEGELVFFRADTWDELAVASSQGGRTTWRNVAGARRDGVEAHVAWRPAARWRIDAAMTWLDASFSRAFLTCSGPCTTPNRPVAAGTPLPGVPRRFGEMSLRWDEGSGLWLRLTARAVAAVPVDDLGSAHAPGYGLLDTALGYQQRYLRGTLEVYAQLDNVLDRSHVSSVIVNDGNGRWFEPGPGRQVSLGANWQWGGAR